LKAEVHLVGEIKVGGVEDEDVQKRRQVLEGVVAEGSGGSSRCGTEDGRRVYMLVE
jgi:hypothetical protein